MRFGRRPQERPRLNLSEVWIGKGCLHILCYIIAQRQGDNQ